MLFDNLQLHDFPDRALRLALQHPENLREVVAAAQPELAAHLDFTQAEYVKPAFLLEDWREREADLLCKVPYLDPTPEAVSVMICLLVEHQSKPDPRLPLRQLLYALLYWEQEWKEYEARHPLGASLQLTPVVPIVFHTGLRAWNSNRTVAELFAGPEALRAFAPAWPVVYWDLAAKTADELLGTDGPFMQLLSIVRAEDSAHDEFKRVLGECAKRLEPLHEQDTMRWRDYLQIMLGWIYQRRPREQSDELNAVVVSSQKSIRAREEAAAVTTTRKESWGEWLKRTTREQMLEEVTKSVTEELTRKARIEGNREILGTALIRAFGSVPDPIKEAIRLCEDIDKLQEAIYRVREMRSLDEFTL